MNERIKKIRKLNGLTQVQFAERLSITQNYVTQIETNSKSPGDRLISDICREFHISEEWLRTGKGEMDAPTDDDFAKVCLEIGATDKRLQKAIIELWKMPPQDRELLWNFLEKLVNSETE